MRFHNYRRDRMLRRARWLMSSPGVISAERTGELIVRAVKKEKALVVTTLPARRMLWRGKSINGRLYR